MTKFFTNWDILYCSVVHNLQTDIQMQKYADGSTNNELFSVQVIICVLVWALVKYQGIYSNWTKKYD